MKSDPDAVTKGLSESQDIYRVLYNNFLDGICLINTDELIEHANPTLGRILCLPQEKLVGRSIFDFVIREDIASVKKHFRNNLNENNPITPCRVRVLKQNGEKVVTEFTSASVEIEGKAVVIVFIRDVTANIEMEQQLHQSQRLHNLGVLASGIAHEFNNLLVGIVGYVSFLKMKSVDDEILPHINVIESSAQKAANLSRQLLTFGKPYITDTRIFEIRDLIDTVTTLLDGTFPKNIRVKTDFNPSKLFVNADLNQLHQVLMNLCLNAKDAMKDGGEIAFSTRPIHFNQSDCRKHGECEPGEYICFSVSDTGTGMDEEVKKRIFDPFFTTKKVGEGSGLGLSTVYGIVKGHHGFLEVTSAPGKGSRFDVYLKAAEHNVENTPDISPEEKNEISDEKQLSGGSANILIVDDESTVREFLNDCLTLLGYSTCCAASAMEALEIYSNSKDDIDLVITDMAMPDMDGLELSEKLYEINPGIRIVMSSGYDTEHVTEKMPLAIIGFIQKPYKIPELTATIEGALQLEMQS